MKAGTARLIRLRHAESRNVVRQQAGALPAARLTGSARRKAAVIAGLLRDEHAGMIYASSAVRSRQTAAIIAGQLDLEVTRDTRPSARWLSAARKALPTQRPACSQPRC
ncbi:MAG: histidine phosphatase family protein [Streptosporangiaceae bacterium]